MQRTFAIRQMRTFSKEFSIEFDGTSSSWLIVLKIIDKNDSSFSLPLTVDADADAYVIKLNDGKCLV